MRPNRRDARKEDRRATMLAVAKASFLNKGYAATSMSAIAAEIGGSKGTLWSYFPSKEALFEAVLTAATTEYRERLRVLLDPVDDLQKTLMGFCRGFLAKVTSAEALALHRLVQAEGQRFPAIGRIFYEQAPLMTLKMVGDYLSEHMAKGHLRSSDPLLAARALVSLCLGGHHQRMLWHVESPDEHIIEHDATFAVDLFLRAYAPQAVEAEAGAGH